MYKEGTSVIQNLGNALNWYTKAAEQSNAAAQFNLAVMYAKGEGTPRDLVLAYQWMLIAQDRGQADAQFRDLLKSSLTADQRRVAQEKAADWLARHQ
jgi:TPR repeat protein